MPSSGGARGVLPTRRLPGRQGRSCDGRGRGGSGAVSHGEGKVNSCRAVIMRRVGVAGQLRPCPSPTGTICDQAQLCLPYQPFRSDFPTTSPSRRLHFLTARGRRGAARHGQRGTAGLARQDRHGTARLPPCTLAPVAPCTVARHNQHGTAWHGYPFAAWHKPRPRLAAAPLPGVIHGMRFSHGCCCCPDLQLQHRPDLLGTWGDPPVQPIPAPPGRAPQRRGLGSPRAVSKRETTC